MYKRQLEKYRDRLCTSELQFGFKSKTSILKVLSYYANNQSSVYCTFLDVSKTFDRVQYCKLFRLLLRRNILPCIVRVWLRFYIGHSIRISWNCVASDFFTAYNGVKQGGVISSVLFCIYIDDLLVQLSLYCIGCWA